MTQRRGWLEVARHAAAQKGQVTLAQFEAAGISESVVGRLVDEARLFRTFRGVCSVGHPAVERDERLMAALLACGEGALLGFQTGAELLGLPGLADGQIHVVVPRGRQVRIRGIRPHQTKILEPQDRFEVRGIPVLSPARLLLDIGDLVARRRVLPRKLERAVHECQVTWGLTLEQVNDVLDRSYGRRGAPHLARACVGRIQISRSELEDAYLRFTARHSLPEPKMNRAMVIDGIEWEFDACFPQHRVAVELDSKGFHATGWAQRRDREKGNAIALRGWTLLRYAWFDLVGDDRRALNEHRRALSLPPLSHFLPRGGRE